MLEGLQWYTSGLSDPRSSLHQEADRDFANARRKAFLRRMVAFLRRDPRSDELLSFERVRRELGTAGQAYLVIQSIPISKIVGSVGRHGDFDGAFLLSKGHLRERWQRINRMWRQGGGCRPCGCTRSATPTSSRTATTASRWPATTASNGSTRG